MMAKRKILKNKNFVSVGLPLLVFCCGSFFGLNKLLSGKKELEDMAWHRRSYSPREYDIEEDYKETLKKLDINDYEIVRIPRPEEKEAE